MSLCLGYILFLALVLLGLASVAMHMSLT
jgi:hypothetical protein